MNLNPVGLMVLVIALCALVLAIFWAAARCDAKNGCRHE